ncbi:MAG: hypothetical protein WA005_11180 [Candidatus Binataceae bacterium]
MTSSVEQLFWGGPGSVWYWHFLGVLTGLWCGSILGAFIAHSVKLLGLLRAEASGQTGHASETVGAIRSVVSVVTGAVLGLCVGGLMGGWLLLAFVLSHVPLWRLPEEPPWINPLDRLVVSVRIDEAFGSQVGRVFVNMRNVMTQYGGLAGGVIGGLVWLRIEAVVVGTILFGIIARLMSFAVVIFCGRLAERRLALRHTATAPSRVRPLD